MAVPDRGNVSEIVEEMIVVIIDVTTCAVDRLDGRSSNNRIRAAGAIPVLMEHKPAATLAEAQAVIERIGFAKTRAPAYETKAGFATMMLAAKARGLPKRTTPLPTGELLRMAMGVAVTRPALRDLSLRLGRWVRTDFLLEGGQFTPRLTNPGLVWALIAAELSTPDWASVTRAATLRAFAGNEAAAILGRRDWGLDFIDQLVFCELGMRLAAAGSTGADVPVASFPLANVPRYDPEGILPADLVPPDFALYFKSAKREDV